MPVRRRTIVPVAVVVLVAGDFVGDFVGHQGRHQKILAAFELLLLVLR